MSGTKCKIDVTAMPQEQTDGLHATTNRHCKIGPGHNRLGMRTTEQNSERAPSYGRDHGR